MAGTKSEGAQGRQLELSVAWAMQLELLRVAGFAKLVK